MISYADKIIIAIDTKLGKLIQVSFQSVQSFIEVVGIINYLFL